MTRNADKRSRARSGSQMAVTKTEAAAYILKLWTDDRLGPDDFHAADVMLRLIFLGCPVSRADVLLVARAYCDSQSENRMLRRRR